MKLWSLRNVVANRSTESWSDGTGDVWARGPREASTSISTFWFWRRLRAVALFSRLLAACLALYTYHIHDSVCVPVWYVLCVWCYLFFFFCRWLTIIQVPQIPYSGKLSREKAFVNFEVWEPSAKVFSTKFWGMPHPLMCGFKQSMKVFSVKFSVPTDLRRFSPSKVYCYMVIKFCPQGNRCLTVVCPGMPLLSTPVNTYVLRKLI